MQVRQATVRETVFGGGEAAAGTPVLEITSCEPRINSWTSMFARDGDHRFSLFVFMKNGPQLLRAFAKGLNII